MGQMNQRLVYRNAYRAMQRAGVSPSQAILSQSYLRLERVAATGVTNYQFGVLVNDQPGGSTIRPNEVRLNLQDSFFVSSIQLFTYNTTNATDTDAVLRTYPDRFVYTTAGAAQALYQLYNGQLSLTVNNRVITPTWDLMRHLVVPQTQQNATLASGVNIDQFEGGTYGEYACEPNWVLIGSKNNNLTINLPNAISTLQASSTTVICLVLRGVLAQNSTQVS